MLTRASRVLFVDRSYTPAENLQAVDRVHRIGQEADSILIMRMTSEHVLDRRINEILTMKERLIEAAIEGRI